MHQRGSINPVPKIEAILASQFGRLPGDAGKLKRHIKSYMSEQIS